MPSWSTSNDYRTSKYPHLTNDRCSESLSEFFQIPSDLAIATEASSHPSGLTSLLGQPYVYAGGGLGNMDECPLQVCLAGGTSRDSLTFASVCVPRQCDALDLAADDFVEKLHLVSQVSVDPELAYEYNVLHERIAELNKFLGTGWTCGEYVVPFHMFPFGGIYVLLSTLLIGLTATATLWKPKRRLQVQKQKSSSAEAVHDVLAGYQEEKKEYTPETSEVDNGVDAPPPAFLSDFNVFINVRKLFIRREATACLDGLRTVSILCVILGHTMAIQSSSGGGYSNPWEFLPPTGLTTTIPGQILFASRFAVDTFLFISGFLVVYVICAKMPDVGENQSFSKRYITTIPGLVLHRLIRILPLYVMTLGFWVEIAPRLGSGPFWYQWENFLVPCRAFGWTNLLFVNNFFPWDLPNVETCFYHSWYLAVDMQLFIVAPLLVFWYQRSPRGGKIATTVLMTLSILVTCFLAYYRKWSINTFDGAAVARFDVEGYAKPHVRAQTYLAGMLLAMMLQDRMLNLSVTLKTYLAMVTALLILALVTFITASGAYSRRACRYEEWPELNECGSTWTAGQTFWYAATSRAFWALGIGIICFLCLQGAGGVVNTFLSLPLWTPLSYLSFGAYLLHPIVIFVYQFGDRQKEPFRLSTFGLNYLAVSIVSFAFSLAFTLIVELPCASISKRLLSRRGGYVLQRPADFEKLLADVETSGNIYGSIDS
jgi:peptidoglycan/LPS O-acetylase OafA/YrhL